jgi:ATP-dependent helicase HrpB
LLTALLVDDRMGMNVPDDFSSHNPAQILKDSHFRMNAEKEASIFGFSLVAGNNTDFDYTALARSFCGSIGFRDRDCVYKLAGGPSLKLDQSSKLPESLLVLHSDHKTGTGLIYQYISLDFNILRLVLKSAAQTVEELYFDRERGTFSAIKKELFGTLVISETRMPVEKMSFFSRSFYDLLEKEGPSILDWKPNDVLLKQRMTCLRVADVADSSLVNALKKFYGESLNQPSQIRLQDVLLSMVEDSKRKFIQDLDEKKFRMENGRNAQLRYEKDGRIVVSARVQDFFGLSKNPVVAGISASVELLSPAGRPVQVTGDLGGFWKNSYQSVRKEMAGRYPKHNWPQNPLAG